MSILCETLTAKVATYMTRPFYPDGAKAMVDGFCANLQESSRRCSHVNTSSLKETILEPLKSMLFYIGFLYRNLVWLLKLGLNVHAELCPDRPPILLSKRRVHV